MKDPFPIAPPESIIELVQPLADSLGLPTLALHAHEVIFAFIFYTAVCSVFAPVFSRWIWPKTYAQLTRRTRLNWDVHITSFVQSSLISAMSLYVIFYDEERKESRTRVNWEGRIFDYTGANGLVQSFALGYFLWDFIICLVYVEIFGWGMLAHAVSAVSVFALGYRPFVYFYAPIFLLYELSSPFLNIHWFCDKLNLTGSVYQAVNGVFLTSTFFGCRLVWGNISSFHALSDIFKAITTGRSEFTEVELGAPTGFSIPELLRIYSDPQYQRLAWTGAQRVPFWVGLVYLAANLVLNSLNILWFTKMIQTIRKRFDPPWGTKGIGNDEILYEPKEKNDVVSGKRTISSPVTSVRAQTQAAVNGSIPSVEVMERRGVSDGSSGIETTGTRTTRTRRKA